jgi:hypothetical protein
MMFAKIIVETKMNYSKLKYFVYSLTLVAFLFVGCTKTEEEVNPYDSVDYGTTTETDSVLDPASIAGLHKNIFSKKCANPGCHDGTFEPDFRTVQSSYSTLIYQNVNKLTVDSVNYFTLRVIPNDYQKSFLYERITTATSDYMPSNSVRLTAQEIDYVKAWIQNGARDMFSVAPTKPNLPPNILGYIAYNSSFVRIDSSRVGGFFYNPFIVPANSTVYIPFLALDTADGSSATDPSLFTTHRFKFSTNKDNFTGATTVDAQWNVPLALNVWILTLNTYQWTSGTTVYFRIYVNDGFQAVDMEFPRNNSLDYYKNYYAFKVQ